MLSFIFQSSAVLLFIAAIALMIVLHRHKRFTKYTKWAVFIFALVAGAAMAGTVIASLFTGAVGWVLGLLGAPQGLIGVAALVIVVFIAVDLLDKQPDGVARWLALLAPTLLIAAGGQLGVFGQTLSSETTEAGMSFLSTMTGL